MKTLLSKYALSAICLICVSASHAQWMPVGTPGLSSADTSSWQHVATDSSNNVYVSFNDKGLPAGQGTVLKYNGTSWNPVGTAGFTPGSALQSNLCIGANGTVYFSYADGTDSSQGAVMMYNGTTWSNIGNNLTAGACTYSNIAADASGNLYFSAIDQASGSVVVKKYLGSSGWQSLGTNPVSGPASFLSMGIARQSGTVWVAYMDVTSGLKRMVKRYVSSSWVDVGLPNPATGNAFDISLAFGTNDTAFVAYWNPVPSGPKPTVEKWDGNTWVNVGTPGFSTGFAQVTSLAVDPNNNTPYLAFLDVTAQERAFVMKYSGGNWTYVGPADTVSPGKINYTSLTVDRNGNLYAGFSDYAYGAKTSVMKYTVCSLPVITTASAAATTICSGDSTTLTVTGTLNGATQWKWYRGSCGGTAAGTGSSIRVAPAANTTYYVRGEDGCVVSIACVPVSVAVNVLAIPAITVSGTTLTSSAATGNQWRLGGQPIPGATNTTYTATTSGWYKVTVTSGNCSKTSDSVFVTVPPAGISPTALSKMITIAPIPAHDVLTVNISKDLGSLPGWQLTIDDVTGRKIFTTNNLQYNNNIDLGSLAPNLYFLKFSNGSDKLVYKIIKQ